MTTQQMLDHEAIRQMLKISKSYLLGEKKLEE